MRWVRGVLTALVAAMASAAEAADLAGRVTFAGGPVPGATVTATKGETRVVTTSNAEGVYTLPELAEGVWTVRVEMPGFAPAVRDITVPPGEPPAPWTLSLLSFDEIAPKTVAAPRPSAPVPAPAAAGGTRVASAAASPPARGARQGGSPAPGNQPRGFQRAEVAATAPAPAVARPAESADESPFGASDGFLINGSVNNGASSPFAQARAFGNNRPGQRSLFNGSFALLSGTSAWDARPYSFTSREVPKPDYTDVQFNGQFGGPIKVPGLRNRPNVYVAGQRSRTNATTAESGLMPTPLERAGDFSRSQDPYGNPVQIVDPQTGHPFAGNVIPADRISPEAASLLAYYPRPNTLDGGFNYQIPLLTKNRSDSVQSRVIQTLTTRQQATVTANWNRTASEGPNVFGFVDSSRGSTLDATVEHSNRLSQFLFLRTRYQFTRTASDLVPWFSGRVNVSGRAGITGNNQDPENWGPPTLSFASGIAGLGTGQYSDSTLQTHAASTSLFVSRGRHNLTYGGGARFNRYDVESQQNARGMFGFTGAATGSDLADFLLGLPQTSAIAYGNADKRLRGTGFDAFVQDDWRLSASLTLNLGLRWEYESPMYEDANRLVNLDVAPGFTSVDQVLASEPTGSLTGQSYGRGLLRPDRSGVQPRVGMAWRPVPGSSLVIRGGYGMYRDKDIYQNVALFMAQQPPLSTTSTVATSAERPLTLADGFVTSSSATLNTFAVDPGFRASFAENWNVSAQRDLPASLTIIGTYLGSRGHRLMQQFLPNSFPAGAVDPCPSCPSGFVYVTSGGRLLRNAAQLQVRRRLRNGFTANVQYTLAKSTDNAAAFAAAALTGAAVAQDWLDLDAEYGRSRFDQRHLLVVQAQYTTGAGITGGTLVDGLKGQLFKDWTLVAQLTTGSGLPLTPVYQVPASGTGVSGAVRASLTGVSPEPVDEGSYLNPASYAPPAPGQWGTAGRNSVTGPAQYLVNAGVGRTFRLGNRMSLDWRFDATNVLNQVNFSSVNMLVGSPQFGLPNRANQMRRLQSSARLRF
jgi:hypothetical protein